MPSPRLNERTVRCHARTRDRYGRDVSSCWADTADVSEWLVANGWALAFRQYSTDYVDVEEQARAQHRGIWSSEFQPPWEWRAERRKAIAPHLR